MTSTDAPSTAATPVARPIWSPLVVDWDLDGTVRSATESYAAQLGRRLDEVIGRKWPDLVVGEEELCRRQLATTVAALQQEDLITVDMPTRVSGRTAWFRWSEVAVRDESGRLVQVHSTGIEVTELYDTRSELAAMIDELAAARALGRRDVLEQLHNGAVQQLAAARWAVAAGEREDAERLIDDALGAVRSSMDSLDPLPAAAMERRPPVDPFWRWAEVQSTGGALPDHIRSPLADVVANAVAVVSSTGSVWLDPDASFGLFDRRTDVDLPTLLAAIHPDDRTAVAQSTVTALAGEEARVRWRYRHRDRGWRQMYTWFSPLPGDEDGPRLAAALTLDITRVDGDPVRDVMDARLDERRRMAQSLHDDVLQQIAGLRWVLTDRQVCDDALAELDALELSVRERLRELDSPVARFGLEAALLHVVDDIATPVESTVTGLELVPRSVAEVVWRSTREALRNVDRHAKAGAAGLQVHCDGRTVRLTVVDDGVGVDDERLHAAIRSGHLGVASMREATTALGGSFELRGREPSGTELRIEIPVRVAG